jgi:hypothetical protein
MMATRTAVMVAIIATGMRSIIDQISHMGMMIMNTMTLKVTNTTTARTTGMVVMKIQTSLL